MRFQAADFLVTHFDFQTVFVNLKQSLFQSATNRAVRSLPVLLLHDLRRAHLFDGRFLKRSLYPKFQFGRRSENNVGNVFSVYVQAADVRIFMEQIHQFFFDVNKRIRQNGARIDALAFVNQKAGNPQRADRTICNVVVMLEIVIDEPVDGGIHRHIDFCIVQSRDARQNDRAAVSLNRTAGKKFVDVFHEKTDRNFFVGIISRQVDADKRNKFNFRMFAELSDNFFLRCMRFNRVKQFGHDNLPFG